MRGLAILSKRHPVAFYIIFFCIGLFAANFISPALIYLFSLLILFLLLCHIIYIFKIENAFRYQIIIFASFFVLLGLFSSTLSKTSGQNDLSSIEGERYKLITIIKTPPTDIRGRFTFKCRNAVNDAPFYISWKYSNNREIPSIGDTLVCKFHSSNIHKSKNRNIYINILEKDINIHKLNGSKNFNYILSTRSELVKIIEKKIEGKREQSLLKAILLGDKQSLDKSIKESFTNSGIIHMLAISGMHTSYLYVIVVYLLFILGKGKIASIIKAFITILIIWYYSIITGLSDSVVRASIMLTLNEITNFSQRSKSSLSTLSICAMIMLILNPESIYNLGFQLSFLATFSICVLSPEITGLFKPKYKIIKYLWNSVVITICGTLGTIIITVMSFNRFPFWFLLGNILCAPLVSLIMLCSIMGLLTVTFPFISNLCFDLCGYFLELLLFIATSIGSLPFANITLI